MQIHLRGTKRFWLRLGIGRAKTRELDTVNTVVRKDVFIASQFGDGFAVR